MDDLSLTLYDLSMNAIDADAQTIELTLIIDTLKNQIILTVSDDGKGMDDAQVRRLTDPFYTTKKTRSVGLGIPYLKQLTEQCDGTLMINSKLGVGTTLSASIKKNHIDCPPFGDLSETLYGLIMHQGTFDLIFNLTIDQQTIHIKKSDIIEATQGLNLFDLKVKQAIVSYIKATIHEIKGEHDL